MNTERDPFYIGYLSKTPKIYARRSWIAVGIITIVTVIAALAIGYYQRPFNNGQFEFGTLTEVTGYLRTTPEPRIIIPGPVGSEHRSIMLVGFGKHGAQSTLEGIENVKGELLDGKEVTMRGTLIYGEGKTWMELTEHTDALVAIGDRWFGTSQMQTGGLEELKGEIIDPKCYFGVMKPGNGSTHRSCAIRCVSGGIPPIFRVTTSSGHPEFYLMKGQAGERINAQVLDFMADEVALTGFVSQVDDWKILQLDPQSIRRIRR